jgi:hypothetical protein
LVKAVVDVERSYEKMTVRRGARRKRDGPRKDPGPVGGANSREDYLM